jgi:hypothetical protein
MSYAAPLAFASNNAAYTPVTGGHRTRPVRRRRRRAAEAAKPRGTLSTK